MVCLDDTLHVHPSFSHAPRASRHRDRLLHPDKHGDDRARDFEDLRPVPRAVAHGVARASDRPIGCFRVITASREHHRLRRLTLATRHAQTSQLLEPCASPPATRDLWYGCVVRSSVRNALAVLAIGAAAGLGVFVWSQTKPRPLESSLDAIPDGAMLLATADVTALRRINALAPIFSETGEIPGIGKVREVCGVDPLEHVVDVAMGVPATGSDGDFGLVASGAIDAEALLSCASKVIEARGGRPVVNPIGSFRTVRDSAAFASSAEIAARDGGPILLGAGSYLRAMIDAADGRVPRVTSDLMHERIAREIGPGALRVTVVLTPEQRRTLNEELARGGAAGSPAAAMLGVGLSVSVDTRVGLSGLVACETANACTDLGQTFETRRTSRTDDPIIRIVGAKPLLERMKIAATGTKITARVDMSTEEATNLVQRLLLLRQALQQQEARDSLEDQRPAPPPPREEAVVPQDAGPSDAGSATDAGVSKDAGIKR